MATATSKNKEKQLPIELRTEHVEKTLNIHVEFAKQKLEDWDSYK